jgi:hypothetical protein
VTGPQQIAERWPQIQAAFASEGVTISLPQALNVLPKLVAALAGPTPPQPARPTIDLSTARIVNAPDVRGWPETATITKVSFDGATTRIEFTKQEGPNRWPDQTPPGWQGPLQYTLWLFLKIEGQWVGSGFIQMWHGRDGSGSSSDPDVPSRYHEHWYYGSRWSPMQDHGPIRSGELIGFMVTAGNARDSVGPMLQERSNVVVFPATDNASFTFWPYTLGGRVRSAAEAQGAEQ